MRFDANTNVVLCFPVEDYHVDKITTAVHPANVIVASQQDIDLQILSADVFCGHAKEKELPWPEVVAQGRLKWIQSSAAGLDHCLKPAVIDSEIPVTSASGLFADQVAEQTMALLFGLIRSMPVFARSQQAKEFVRRPTDDLHGKTVGIVGFGGNGRRIAELLSVMKVRIIATDVFPVDKPNYVDQLWPADQLNELLEQSDVVIVCVPLNSQTERMFGAAEFATVKTGAYFVNVARGPVVDEQALVSALVDGTLKGAGLDVTDIEPLPESSPLWDLPNVLITPHVGAQSFDRVDVTVDFFCDNVKRFLAGEPLLNHVDKVLGFPRPEHRP
ncbi:MAG: D-2-hydroxyacid dehydrogenase [Planctomycetales bacterium]|nr:D-2-hydroxyacid dehydrogenase [Planctomycetales bacterium]